MARPSRSTDTRPVVVITGMSGLIGTAVARELARDHRLIGLDVQRPEELPDTVLWVECDLTETASVRTAVERVAGEAGSRVASVIHLAAYYDFSGEPSPLYDGLTVEGTRRLLESLQALPVEQFVFSSSLLVMKPAEEREPLDETSPVRAEWHYPRSKLEAEQVIRERRGRIPAVILRIAGVYDDEGHSIPIGQQIRRIHERKLESFFFPRNPGAGQAFVHLEDLVACFRQVVERRDRLDPLEVFLVGQPETLTYADLQDRLGELIHGREWPTIRIPAPLAKAGAWLKEKLPGEDPFIKPWMIDLADSHYPVSIAKAQARLGWQPRRRLSATLPEIVRRLKADPARWYEINGLAPSPAPSEAA